MSARFCSKRIADCYENVKIIVQFCCDLRNYHYLCTPIWVKKVKNYKLCVE